MDRRVSMIRKCCLSEVVGRWKWLQPQPRVATEGVLGISVSLLFPGVLYGTIFCMATVDFDRQCACKSSTTILTEVEVQSFSLTTEYWEKREKAPLENVVRDDGIPGRKDITEVPSMKMIFWFSYFHSSCSSILTHLWYSLFTKPQSSFFSATFAVTTFLRVSESHHEIVEGGYSCPPRWLEAGLSPT